MKKIICVLVLCGLVFTGIFADNAPEFTGWKQAETRHFRFVYEDASREAAEAYAQIADECWNMVAEVYSLPRDMITVYVVPRTNTVNASTYFAPLSIVMYTTPFVIPDFTYRDSWIKYVFLHELIHAANISFESRDTTMADIFGDFFGLMDFSSVNGWELEGLTTVLETELTDAGRGRSPYFELLYKAPAMEGCLLSYDEIGLQEEPPAGQIYVYGYLMMRSLADRWGLKTLADIERNRENMGMLEDSVIAVTGESAPDIWRDVKIALTKRYARERSIPEGKIITPRYGNYYKPAVILDDGTMIMLRNVDGVTEVISFNPNLPSGDVYYDELGDDKPYTNVTVLFRAPVPDEYSVTADRNGKVYASLSKIRADRAPGVETEYQIYSWDKENGLQQLTSGSSYFQPSVSRDGKVLVALEQSGLHMRLVQIDVESGETTVLLDDPDYDMAMPAVNQDGSKVAMLRAGKGRAAVAVFDMSRKARGVADASALTVVANGEGTIIDPAYPSWNYNGSLTYCSNERGRLEVFEVTADEDGTFTSTPVAADPVGVLWAYRTPNRFFYASYSASGYTLKAKPLSEWGVVPDWNGPSMPGEIVCIGDLEDDFKNFVPYTNADKEVIEERNTARWVNDETIVEPITELQNERKYVNLPQKYMTIPMISLIKLPDDKMAFGFGGFYMGMSSQLMGRISVTEADVIYYPKINNFSADAGFELNLNNSVLDVFALRQIQSSDTKFTETNRLLAGLTIPFYNRSNPLSFTELSLITTATGGITRKDTEAFAFNDDISCDYMLSGAAGLGFCTEKCTASYSSSSIVTSSAVALFNWDDTLDKFYYGCEADLDVKTGSDKDGYYGFYLQGRYLDAPDSLSVYNSTMKHGGKRVDCTDPANFLARLQMTDTSNGFDLNLYEEGMCSISKNGAFKFDDILATGFEAAFGSGHESLAAGITLNYDLKEKKTSFGDFYFTLKLNFIRW